MSAPDDDERARSVDRTVDSARDRVALLLAIVCSVVVVVPLWSAQILPMPDLAGHLGLASSVPRILHGDPIAQRYAISPYPMPYTLVYALLAVVQPLTSTWIAARAVVVAALLLPPWGFVRLSRALGRSTVVALLAFVVAWDFNVEWGFVAFSIGVGLSLFALAAVLDADDVKGALRATPWCLLVALTHAQAAALLCAGLFTLVVARPGLRQRIVVHAIAQAALLLGLAPWLIATVVEHSEHAAPAKYHWEWPSWSERVAYGLRHALDTIPGDTPHAIAWCGFALVVVTLLLGGALSFLSPQTAPRAHRADGSVVTSARVLPFVLLLQGCFWLLPLGMAWPISQYYVYTRHAALALIGPLLLLIVDVTRVRIGRVPAAVLPAALCIGVLGETVAMSLARAQQLRDFDARARELRAVLDVMPDHARLAYYAEGDRVPMSKLRPFLNADGWIVAEKGAYSSTLWDTDKLPVRHRPPRPPLLATKSHVAAFELRRDGPLVDYVVACAPPGVSAPSLSTSTRVLTSAHWQVWRVRHDDGAPGMRLDDANGTRDAAHP